MEEQENIFLFCIIIILVTMAMELIFKPKWYNESTEIAKIRSNITHDCLPS